MLASETPALDIVGAHFVRELEPGEMVVIDADGARSLQPFAPETVDPPLCLFEFVYFARPDSRLYGQSVHQARIRMGEQLAEQAPVEADMVMGVPESGSPAAEGFARRSGIPYGQGLVKNRYIGRSFIAPSQELRARAVRMKLNPLRENIAGKRLVVVDDSIVRGTTQQQLVRMLREAGATEVHLRITSPPVRWSCFYGIDTGDRTELLAAQLDVDEIREYLDVDTPRLPQPRPAGHRHRRAAAGFCHACFTGDYPVEVPVTLRKTCSRTTRCRRRSAVGTTTRRRRRPWPGAGRADGGRDLRGAGVDIAAGEEAVERIKAKVRSTFRPEVIGDIGGFGGLFAFARTATGTPCWSRPPTASAPRRSSPRPPAGSTPSASTSSPCASTTSCARAPSRCSSSTTSRSASSTPTTSSSSSTASPRAAARPAAP